MHGKVENNEKFALSRLKIEVSCTRSSRSCQLISPATFKTRAERISYFSQHPRSSTPRWEGENGCERNIRSNIMITLHVTLFRYKCLSIWVKNFNSCRLHSNFSLLFAFFVRCSLKKFHFSSPIRHSRRVAENISIFAARFSFHRRNTKKGNLMILWKFFPQLNSTIWRLMEPNCAMSGAWIRREARKYFLNNSIVCFTIFDVFHVGTYPVPWQL